MNSPGYDSDDDDFDPFDNWQSDEYVENEIEKLTEDCSEDFNHAQMNVTETGQYFNQCIQQMCRLIDVPRTIARCLLIKYVWDVDRIKCQFSSDPLGLMIREHLLPGEPAGASVSDSSDIMATLSAMKELGCPVRPYFNTLSLSADSLCQICFSKPSLPKELFDNHHLGVTDLNENLGASEGAPSFEVKPRLYGLSCGHRYCLECWSSYLSIEIMDSITCLDIQCMSDSCDLIVPEDFILTVVYNPKAREKYRRSLFTDMVSKHPSLRSCRGPDCNMIMRALEPVKARRIHCTSCQHEFCFACGDVYHAPTSCSQMKEWLKKCDDDTPTINYITTRTKLCPACNVCINKDGGCSHMKCSKCKYDFCWICLAAYSERGHSCSVYNETTESHDALRRYFFYYERWRAHAESLQLEEIHQKKVKERIEEKVSKHEGTWIDWQHLVSAADNLRRCRYTLKYTYPLAYFMKVTDRKDLFEDHQAQLEQHVEDLAWKIEHSELHDHAALQNTIDVCEKYRMALLREFLD